MNKSCKMSKIRYSWLFVVFLGVIATGCQSDFEEGFRADTPTSESGNVVTLVSARADGVISLSIDALAHDRSGAWIDLDGNGKRAKDGSEDVKLFNAYQEYQLAVGVRSVTLHGDITYLGAASNELTGVDVSGNPLLKVLNLPLNRLESIDLSSNSALERLDVSGNHLSTLELSSNTALKTLWVFNNELSSLDLSASSNLAFLDVSGNGLSALDLSNNPNLVRLLAYNNRLSSIDIPGNGKLSLVWLFGNPMGEAEAERVVSMLNETSGGELWMFDVPLSEALSATATAKGWVIP